MMLKRLLGETLSSVIHDVTDVCVVGIWTKNLMKKTLQSSNIGWKKFTMFFIM